MTHLPGWFEVTKSSHPTIHGVLEDVSHDAGGGAGHEAYLLPGRWEHELPGIEAALAALSEEDLADFAIGEESDQERVASQSPELRRAQTMLEDFFDNCGAENDDLHREKGTYRG